MESCCKALSNQMALKYSTFHKKSLWWKLTSCIIEVTSEKMTICYIMQLKSFQSHEDFTNPWLWGGGGFSIQGLAWRSAFIATVTAADGKALLSCICPPTHSALALLPLKLSLSGISQQFCAATPQLRIHLMPVTELEHRQCVTKGSVT